MRILCLQIHPIFARRTRAVRRQISAIESERDTIRLRSRTLHKEFACLHCLRIPKEYRQRLRSISLKNLRGKRRFETLSPAREARALPYGLRGTGCNFSGIAFVVGGAARRGYTFTVFSARRIAALAESLAWARVKPQSRRAEPQDGNRLAR
jgi:hypothetical protein